MLLGVVAAAIGAAVWFGATRLPRRFAAVEPGRLYRCGSVTPTQLETLQREHGVRTVLSLLDPAAPESVAEKAAAERLQMTWLNVPLRGNGDSTPADRERLRAILLDGNGGPLLVHCAAGVNRTGLAVGMYRLHAQGWTLEQVREEMLRFDFEDLAKHEGLRRALEEEAQAAEAQRRNAKRKRARRRARALRAMPFGELELWGRQPRLQYDAWSSGWTGALASPSIPQCSSGNP